MATGLITVLSNVPWSDVIRHAPKVAEGARKLWDRARGKAVEPEPVLVSPPAMTAEQQALATLEARTAALQTAVLDLQSQMAESSALIKELADLNEQMIQHVQAQDRRLWWLGVASVALGVAAALGWLLVYWRPAG